MNKREIRIGSSKFTVIKLYKSIDDDVEVFPGDPKVKKTEFCNFNEHKCRYNIYSVGDHVFQPHGDAPKHHNEELEHLGFDYWDLSYSFTNACLIDLTEYKNKYDVHGFEVVKEIEKSDIERNMELLKDKEGVIFRTGYDKIIENNLPHLPENIPYITKEAAELLKELTNIKVVALDSLTVDAIGLHDSHILLKEKMIVESMVFLESVPKEFRSNFTFQTSPVAIKGSTGGPIVAYAFIEDAK